ncbi:glutathione S-transferase family protein [Arenicellales bacterium IMCC58067]
MKLTFIYFDFPFWRAEVGRIALFMGGIEFENRLVDGDEFNRVQQTGHLDDGTSIPFHQLPCLIIDGVPIAQTAGIARFCGKLSGMYPKDDDLLAGQIDQFLDFATDITELIFSTSRDDDDLIKKAKRETLASDDLPRKLQMLEKCINAESQWVVGPQLGLADLAIWRMMGWLSSGIVDGIPATLLSAFPKTAAVCRAVDAHPQIQDWVAKTYPDNYIRGHYG